MRRGDAYHGEDHFQDLSVEGIVRLSEKWSGIFRISRDFVAFCLEECLKKASPWGSFICNRKSYLGTNLHWSIFGRRGHYWGVTLHLKFW